MRKLTLLASFGLIALTGCDAMYPPTANPDYTIHVTKTDKGVEAIAPTCPDWTNNTANPFDQQPMPQFGCATARNLAIMVAKPEDLIKGRDSGDSSGVMAVGAMRRYYGNQTRGLIDTDTAADTAVAVTTAPSTSSSLTGDVTGGGSAPSSGSSSSSSAAVP